MDLILQPWHWMVLGLALIIFEIFLPSFTALWFGVAACVVAVLLWIFPRLGTEVQLMSWIILSIGFTVLWFKFLKPLSRDKTKAGLAREAILGQVGIIIAVPLVEHTGVVRFAIPLLGADEWRCRSQQELAVGDRVTVVEILGNELVVIKN
ncbi:NfeD family protein [Alkanindiges illinoisensis]|uniref:NfeD family protein n=1 Tax=Alkanindiges illinoisensis TaxID=197183 RepID=UPI00047929B7|nr:NfeD family protein [Alkanindiges illinoisensis]